MLSLTGRSLATRRRGRRRTLSGAIHPEDDLRRDLWAEAQNDHATGGDKKSQPPGNEPAYKGEEKRYAAQSEGRLHQIGRLATPEPLLIGGAVPANSLCNALCIACTCGNRLK